MKKLLIAFLLSLTCACTVAGMAACDDSTESSSGTSSSQLGEANLSLTFAEGEGYSFEPSFAADKKFAAGETAAFTLKVGAFYAGYHIVYLNGEAIAPNPDDPYGYTVTVTENAEITVSGIERETSQMQGMGSFDSPYVVTRPIDLVYIAEQVNAGNYSYVTATYVLANDIDCGGEELDIIGDLSTENSYFSGCFIADADPVTGIRQKFTISNFEINSDDANYVGLFGAVYADLSVTNSALFYGICLDNFTITATLPKDAPVDNRSISAGSLIGYSIGANLWLCDATNGSVNIIGNDDYFSFAGGLIGYQQAFYAPALDSYFPSEIVYSVVDVDVDIVEGLGMYAGGITGYLATTNPYGATAFIHNSYAMGDVSGALYAGGIVGGLGSYTSVTSSYATGTVSAKSDRVLADTVEDFKKYCYAYAGGIAGYAENESVVSDCFSVSSVYASSVSAGCNGTGAIVGNGDGIGTTTASANAYVVENCLSKNELDLSDTSFLTEKLGWGDYDWVFVKDGYPTICYEASSDTIQAYLTIKYVDRSGEEIKVRGQSGWTEPFMDTSIQSTNYYTPIGNYFLSGSLSTNIQADNGYRAYGYFFDQECTRRVPYAYVLQKSVTLYVGFADPAPVVNKTYSMVYNHSADALTVSFDKNGIATYSDGSGEQKAYYLFDGETIVIQAARLARYYDGEIVVDANDPNANQDASFDISRYSYYDFKGKLTENGLVLYDGVYFTESAPLVFKTNAFRGEYYIGDTTYIFYGDKVSVKTGANVATYDNYIVTETTLSFGATTINISDLKAFDAFKGSWTKSANVNKVYTFDGKGGWTYAFGDVTESGTYTRTDDSISFTHGGVAYTASYDTNGMLTVTGEGTAQTYYAAGSHVGVWHANDVKIELLGIGRNGWGDAIVTYTDGTVYKLVYEMSETNGYVVLYYPHDAYGKDAAFGYFYYNNASNTLGATLVDASTGVNTALSLRLLDSYNGEWICDAEEFLSAEFRFNGNGLYSGMAGSQGQLTIIKDGVETVVTYTLDGQLGGSFTYDGKQYTMVYDENANSVVLTNASGATLERKDELANIDFVDRNGVSYSFDGRSNLSTNGILTVKDGAQETSYTYAKNGDGWLVKSGVTTVGSVALTENCYTLTIGETATKLYVTNEFMGNWAVGGHYGLLEVGPTDLNDNIQATFLGHEVVLTQLEVGLLTFRYRDGNKPVTYYVFIVEDTVLGYDLLVISQYTNLYSGGYNICTKANEYYGEWTRNDGDFAMSFDGVTSGAYANGAALLYRGDKEHATPYYYTAGDRGTMLWSQDALAGSIMYYKLEWLDASSDEAKANDVFVQKDEDGNIVKAFRRVKVDSLYMTEAKDSNNPSIVYFFDGLGKLYVGDEIAYEYKLVSFDNTSSTAKLTLTKDGKTYDAVLNYKDSQNITLTITEAVESV